MGDRAFLIAIYPFVIAGAGMALVSCLYASYRLRHNGLVIRWLFAGICLSMVALMLENIYFFAARALDIFDPANDRAVIGAWKFLYGLGAWLHVAGAVAAIKGLSHTWVKRMIGASLLTWVALYLGLVWILY